MIKKSKNVDYQKTDSLPQKSMQQNKENIIETSFTQTETQRKPYHVENFDISCLKL